MAKIKLTKNALKAQRDALQRFERYLPTLQLKKQQLQAEVRRVEQEVRAKASEEETLRVEMTSWIALFSEPFDFEAHLKLAGVRVGEGNIAGVGLPVFEAIEWERVPIDFFTTPPWTDDGAAALERLLHLRVERGLLEEQQRLLSEELRTTNQRVNLFEKVKIPESREHIRVIRIALGDQETAAVARSKKAKSKTVEKVRSA